MNPFPHILPDLPDDLPPEIMERITDPEWLRRAAEFLEKWERVGPVEDNTWRPRQR